MDANSHGEGLSDPDSHCVPLVRGRNRVPNPDCLEAGVYVPTVIGPTHRWCIRQKSLPHQTYPFLTSIQHQDPAPVPQSARPTLAICHSLTPTNTIPLAHSHQPKHSSTANMVAYTILSVLGLTLTAMASPVPAAEPGLLSGVTGAVSGVTNTVSAVAAPVVSPVVAVVEKLPALRKSRTPTHHSQIHKD